MASYYYPCVELQDLHLLTVVYRVKLPKTFLAINLSDLFSFEDHERRESDSEGLEMKSLRTKPKTTDTAPVAAEDTEAAPAEEMVAVGECLGTASIQKEKEAEEPVSPGTIVEAPTPLVVPDTASESTTEATTQETTQ